MAEMIPKISRERILELYQRIKPVKRSNQGYREIIGWTDKDGEEKIEHRFADEPKGLTEIAFTWDPLLGDQILGLQKIDDIETRHSCGYYGFFKPDVGEVLAQIPNKYLDEVVAFETSIRDEDVQISGSGSYHISKTRLFKKKQNR